MITSKSAGEYIIHGKLKAVVLPLIVIVLVNFFVTPISGKEGYAMLGAIPLTILCSLCSVQEWQPSRWSLPRRRKYSLWLPPLMEI